MAESIKDKVAIVGMGCSRFGERWDAGLPDLIVEATYEAYEDAGIGPEDIEAAWVGNMYVMTGAILSQPLKLQYKPISRTENACISSEEALRMATFALVAKVYDLVLVVGAEKLKDAGFGEIGEAILPCHPQYAGYGRIGEMLTHHPVYEVGPTAAGRYALAATRYFHKYGLSPEEGKKLLAMISVKNHNNGARNPKAYLGQQVTIEEVMNAPIIAWPLGLLDCCGVTDGAATAVLCRAEDAKRFRDDYVLIKGIGVSIGPGQGSVRTDYDFTFWDETYYASQEAYRQAGIKNPREELDLVECHDCFSIAELITCESLGLCPVGRAREDIESGAWIQEGEIPVNLSGGLISFGHPVGASGCRETYEIYKQLQGKAEESSRQLRNPRMGLVHNQGGVPGKFVSAAVIYGLPE